MPISKTFDGLTVTVHDDERQVCDVYSRVVGYFQPLSHWNIGKRGEHKERLMYTIDEPSFTDEAQQKLDL